MFDSDPTYKVKELDSWQQKNQRPKVKTQKKALAANSKIDRTS